MPEARRILVTGASGQLGAHTVLRLKYRHHCTVLTADRAAFADPALLADLVAQSDGVLHLAGVNRGDDAAITDGNIGLAEALVAAAAKAGRAPPLAYASTIHVVRDDAYGRAKNRAGEILGTHWSSRNASYAQVLLPNLFGEFSRPAYNNFTGTFCHQIVAGNTPTVHSDAPVELLHYGDAAETLFGALDGHGNRDLRPAGHKTSVAAVAGALKSFHETYAGGVIPDLGGRFELGLFNALRQVMFEYQFPAPLVRHADARGAFVECVRAGNMGQTSFSTTRPGITRGNHFHCNLMERFVVLSGKARISVRRLTDNRIWHFDVDGDAPCFVDMPTLHTHNITNTGGDDLYTLFWVNKFFDPQDPDTFMEPV